VLLRDRGCVRRRPLLCETPALQSEIDHPEGSEMASKPAVLEEAQALLRRRLDELDDERKRLERALAELGGKAAPGRPRGRKTGKSAPRTRRRRKRRGGTRADQAVKHITDKPGINASDVAKAMKIKPNYLYRVLGDLEKEGRVKKGGRQYFPAS
jgi:hypothetical protein